MTAHDSPAWSPRQKEVLDLLARGKTNGQIAEALGISLDGAKWHVGEIITKLDVDTRDEAAEYWRQRQGFRARLRVLTRTGSAPSALRWLGIGGAAVVVLGVAAVAAFALLNGGGEPVSPDPSPTAATTTTAAPAETPTLPAGEVPVVELAAGEPVGLAGAILYYAVNLPSDAPDSYDRAYADSDGQLVEETFRLWVEETLGSQSTVLNLTVSAGARTLMAYVCLNPCPAGIAGPRELAWLLSTDGGISWERLGGRFDEVISPAWARVVGVLRDGRLVIEQPEEFWIYPSGESLEPPRADVTPVVTSGGELLWEGRSVVDTTTVIYWDSSGEQVFALSNVDSDLARADAGAVFHITHIDEKDRAYFLSHHRRVSEIRVVSRSGEVLEAYRWPGMLTAAGGPEDGMLVGIVHAPGEDDQERLDRMPPEWEEGPAYPWRLALIDLAAGEIRPIDGLQPLGLAPGGRLDGLDPGVQAVLMVNVVKLVVGGMPILRVDTGGSCLNVRTEPSTGAASLRCYADGVLLFEREADAPEGWVAVTAPDGREGWASAEFLAR